MRKIVKIWSLALALLFLGLWSGCADSAGKESQRETQTAQGDRDVIQETESESVVDRETTRIVETVSPSKTPQGEEPSVYPETESESAPAEEEASVADMEIYNLSELLRLEEWVTEDSEILLMVENENMQSEIERPGDIYRVESENIPVFLEWAKNTEVLPCDEKMIYPLYTIVIRDGEPENWYESRENNHDIMLYGNSWVGIDNVEGYMLAEPCAFCVDDFLEIFEPVEIFSVEDMLLMEVSSRDEGDEYVIEYMDTEYFSHIPYIIVESGTEEIRGVECRYEIMWRYYGYSFWKFGIYYEFGRIKTYYRIDTGEYFDRYDTYVHIDFITGRGIGFYS